MYKHTEKKKSITIIIPVKNEENSIVKNLKLLQKEIKIPYSIIVVDGCSTDQTYNLVQDFFKKNERLIPNSKIIRTPIEKSCFKDSIDIGIQNSTTDIIAVMMGDLCDDPKTINIMYKKAEEGYDMIIGSRYMNGGAKIGEPLIQGFISRMVSKTLHLLTDIPIHDVSNPFRMYKKKLINEIKTTSYDNEIPIELLFKAYINGAKIIEVPTTWKGRKSGKSKFKLLKVVPGYAKLYLWILIAITLKRLKEKFNI